MAYKCTCTRQSHQIHLSNRKQTKFPQTHIHSFVWFLLPFSCFLPVMLLLLLFLLFLVIVVARSPKLIHFVSFFFLLVVGSSTIFRCSFFTTICGIVPVLLFFPLFRISFLIRNSLKQCILSLLALGFFLVNGVVMICDGVKSKFPWTTILFLSLCVPPFCALNDTAKFSHHCVPWMR